MSLTRFIFMNLRYESHKCASDLATAGFLFLHFAKTKNQNEV